MLIITYYELNPNLDPTKITEAALTIIKKGMLQQEGITEIGSYISTSDYWGITIVEAENEEASVRQANMWRVLMPGMFTVMKSSPAMKMEEVLPIIMGLKKKLKD